MSIFTNPASASKAQGQAYTRAILDLVGERDPLGILKETARALRDAVAGLSDAELSVPEREGKWSIRQVVRHLADSELVWAWRLRLVLAQERPQITGYDQDAWAERLAYGDADVTESIEEFAIVRRGNLRLLAAADRAAFERVGVHAERGEESVAHMMRLYAGHDLLHRDQITRIRAATGA